MSDSSRQVTVVPDGSGFQMVGQTISGRYKVEALLGAGGMGSVYLVQHTAMRKRYALKVLNSQTAQVPEMVARFEREAMAAAHVEHPNITVAIDFGKTDDGSFYLVLEYLEGKRVRDALGDGPMTIARAIHITRQIASALELSHSQGIIHRDLKPENIMLVSRQGDPNFVKVLDFGLAKVSTVEPGSDIPAQVLTKHGTIAGTPKYMAPEQCVGGALDGRADLYALGLILYEMLTGVHPFAAKDMLRIIRHQLTTPTPPMKSVAPHVNVPASLEAVVMRLTEKEPEKRYENATALLAALTEVAEKEGITPPEHASGPVSALARHAASKPGTSGEVKTVNSVDLKSVVELAPTAAAVPTPAKKQDEGRTVTSIEVIAEDVAPSVAKPKSAAAKPAPQVAQVPQAPKEIAAPIAPVAQAAQNPLQPIIARLPPSLQKIHPGLLFGAPIAVLGVLLFLLLRSSGSADSEPAADKSPTKSTAPTATIAQAQIDQAGAAGTSALLNLARKYPKDARIFRALWQGALAQKNGTDALRFMAQGAALDPGIVTENDIKQATALAMSTAESADATITMVEEGLGAFGVDVLYSLAARPGPSKLKARLNQSLARKDVRARASAAALVAIELRATEKCEEKYELLDRASKHGDQRALEQLKLLTVTRNCGAMGLVDCWPCLRKDTALQGAIASIESRIPAAN